MSINTILENCNLVLKRNDRFCEGNFEYYLNRLNNIIIKNFDVNLEYTGLSVIYQKMIKEIYDSPDVLFLLGSILIDSCDIYIRDYSTATNNKIKITTTSVKYGMVNYLNYDILLDMCKSSQIYLLYFP